MQMGHLVGVLLRVKFMWGVEDKPFSNFEHSGEKVHILLVGQLEILGTNGGSFGELFGDCYSSD